MSAPPVIIQAYEAAIMKAGHLIITFDADDDFAPKGDLVSADVHGNGALALTWSNGTIALLPDVGMTAALAKSAASAPEISVRWVADGLFRGSEFRRP